MKSRTTSIVIMIALAAVAACALPVSAADKLIDQALADLSARDQDVNGFTFLVVGDTRHWIRFEQPETFRQIVREANALDVAFLIDVGDLLSTGYAEEPEMRRMWDGFIEVVNMSEVPFFPVVGNHDVANDMHERLWLEYAGPIWFSFDYGGCHFIAMNSDQAGYGGLISDEHFEWLRKDLANTNARHIFVFLHQPVFSNPRQWTRVHELLRRYPTRAVIAGHAHIYRELPEVDGIRYYISGGGGAEIGDDPTRGSFHHYMLVSVRGDEVHETVVRPGNVLPTDCLAGPPEQRVCLVNRLDYKQIPGLGGLMADSLSAVEDTRLVDALAQTAASGDVNARPLAIATIERLSQPALVPGLSDLARSDDAELRVAAAAALGRAGSADAIAVLADLLDSGDGELRMAAVNALGHTGAADAIEPLRGVLAADDQDLRVAAIRAIGEIGGPRGLAALRGVLASGDEQMRMTAVDAAGRLDVAGVVETLDAALRDSSPAVQDRAMQALEPRGLGHPPGAELVTVVPIPWRVAVDADEKGESEGWHTSDFDDSAWIEARTDSPWYRQDGPLRGLSDAVAWGRVRFTVDEKWSGRRIIVRVGALDEGGTIYLNGEKLLDRAAGVDTHREPFEIDVTGRLRFGEPNVLAVRAFAETTLGGVWKPVSVYTAPQ
ncbi:MAG: HEAT repeat domain-containing protein [Armatimonadota bacterium]|nr:MAG: HEAT repeat domain-containing protein [Armatimonadota bacterium]